MGCMRFQHTVFLHVHMPAHADREQLLQCMPESTVDFERWCNYGVDFNQCAASLDLNAWCPEQQDSFTWCSSWPPQQAGDQAARSRRNSNVLWRQGHRAMLGLALLTWHGPTTCLQI